MALTESTLPYINLALSDVVPTIHRICPHNSVEIAEAQVKIALLDFPRGILTISAHRGLDNPEAYTIKIKLRASLTVERPRREDIKKRFSETLTLLGGVMAFHHQMNIRRLLDKVEKAGSADELMTLLPPREREMLRRVAKTSGGDISRLKTIAKATLLRRATSFLRSIRLVIGTAYYEDGGEKPITELRCDLRVTGVPDDDFIWDIAREISAWLKIAYALLGGRFMPRGPIDTSLIEEDRELPPSIRKKLLKTIRTKLTSVVNKIEKITKLKFLPRVKVVPFALVKGPVVNLGVITTSAAEDHLEPVIFISAPTVLFVDEETLTSHILNLFMYYIVTSIIIYYGLMVEPHEYVALQGDVKFWTSIAKLIVKDEYVLKALYEYITNDMIIKAATNEIVQKWLNEGYPAGWIDGLVETRLDLPVVVDLDLVEKVGHEIALMIIEWLMRFRGESSI